MAKTDAKAFLADRQRAYQTVFGSPAGKAVLADMKKFCRGGESTFHPDARVSAALDGRREYYLRVIDHIDLNFEDLWVKYGSNM